MSEPTGPAGGRLVRSAAHHVGEVSAGRLAGRLASQSGSAAIELVLITPALVLLLLVALAAGRFSVARNQVTEAARDAAREASTWRNPLQAAQQGEQRGLASLAASRVSCGSPRVLIDTSQLHPGGEAVADVSCTVSLADAVGLHLGGSQTFRARAVAVVDTFRSDRLQQRGQ